MIVITASNIPDRLCGKLSLWCAQVNPNTFVSRLPSEARETLWEAIQEHAEMGDVTFAYEDRDGLQVRQFGRPDRVIIDRHGIPLSHRLD